MKDSSSFLSQIKQLVLDKEPTAKIYLYGSRAKGHAHDKSDWDLLILVRRDKVSREVETSITDPLYDLEFETGELISPMVYSESEWNNKYSITPFYRNVMREGQLL
jgi:predicted nucleotidyltransferase